MRLGAFNNLIEITVGFTLIQTQVPMRPNYFAAASAGVFREVRW